MLLTLKQWGIMVYSTCTITPEENQGSGGSLLPNTLNLKKLKLLQMKMSSSSKEQELVLYPHQYMTDGFFICCMRKVSSNEVK